MSESDRIRDFLVNELHCQASRSELTDELPLIESHVLDSMGLLRLVAWMEETYGIEITDAQVVPANFGTIGAIDRLIGANSGR